MKRLLFLLLALLAIVACTPEEHKMNRVAVFETTMGNFSVEMAEDLAPNTTANFITLAQKGFYTNTTFHRVIKGFMIQGGDPKGDGTGGPGYKIKDEFHPALSNVRGTISMANAGPNTGGSQFFINVVDNTFLDYNKPPPTSQHAVFGKVIAGMEVVDNISKVPTSRGNDKPLTPVIVKSITIKQQ